MRRVTVTHNFIHGLQQVLWPKDIPAELHFMLEVDIDHARHAIAAAKGKLNEHQ